jgi:hypothetical protein
MLQGFGPESVTLQRLSTTEALEYSQVLKITLRMYVCMYVCMHACMLLISTMHVHARFVSLPFFMSRYVYVHVHVYVYVYVSRLCVCMYVSLYVSGARHLGTCFVPSQCIQICCCLRMQFTLELHENAPKITHYMHAYIDSYF